MYVPLKETPEDLFLELPQNVLDQLGVALGETVELTPTRSGFLIEPLPAQDE